jgi:hypothetical protein
MVLLLLFASAASLGHRALRKPAILLVNVTTLFFCLFLAFTVTAFAFSWPSNWAAFLGLDSSSDIQNFAVLGDTVNFGCERGATSNVVYIVPTGFRLVNAYADTAEVVGAKSASANIVSRDARTATAKADFLGRDLDWVHNCPGGGHGRVKLRGEYVQESPPLAVTLSGIATFSLASLAAAFALFSSKVGNLRV